MEYHYEYSTYNSHHKVLINLQASNMDALKNPNYGLCWPTQWQTMHYALFKLLPEPLKLLLSQLCKFCQNSLGRPP